MSGWIGRKKRRDVPEAYRPLIGLTVDEARAYVSEHKVIGIGTGGTEITEITAISGEPAGYRTLVWTPWILTVYTREDGRIVDVGDAG